MDEPGKVLRRTAVEDREERRGGGEGKGRWLL